MLESVAREDLRARPQVAKQEECRLSMHQPRVNLVLHERHEHGERHEPGDDLHGYQHGHLVASEIDLLAVIIGIDGAYP